MKTNIESVLGDEMETLLRHQCTTIPKESLVLPGSDFVDRVVALSDRRPRTLRSLQTLFNHGRLASTGYLSILPVDQGVEHAAGASFAPNPIYFDPEKHYSVSHRRGVQCRGFDRRHPGFGGTQICAQKSHSSRRSTITNC